MTPPASNTFRLPRITDIEPLPGISTSGTLRHLAALGARHLGESGEVPPLPDSRLPTTTLRLEPALEARLRDLAEEHGLDFPDMFAAACLVGRRIMRDNEAARRARLDGGRVNVHMPMSAGEIAKGPDQEAFFSNLWVGMQNGDAAFAEAPTGIGKGLAICAVAARKAAEGHSPVVVATATVPLVADLYSQFISGRLDTKGVRATILPGMREFVDDVRLRRYIAQMSAEGRGAEIDQAVIDWVEAGGPCAVDNGPTLRAALSHVLQGTGEQARWLFDDLKLKALTLDIEEFRLKSAAPVEDEPSEARACLAAFRDIAKSAGTKGGPHVVFCTHAMLAWAKKTAIRLKPGDEIPPDEGWRLMPPPKTILIDEAHQFEQAVAAAYSHSISLFYLLALVGGSGGSKAVAAKAAVRTIIDDLAKLGDANDRIRLSGADADPDVAMAASLMLDRLNKLVVPALKARKGDDDEDGEKTRYREAVNRIVNILSGKVTSERIDVTFSPDRRFPSVSSGTASVGGILHNLWQLALDKGGVGCVSATLFVTDANGNSNCNYIRSLLAIPPQRLNTSQVRSRWMFSTPMLYLPNADAARKLTPPSHREVKGIGASAAKTLNNTWLDAVAAQMHAICNTAAGGTLVLCTSYDQVDGLTQRLATAGIGSDRLIPMEKSRKFAITEALYRDAYADDRRPIMMGVGSAWTGVNLVLDGVAAETDMLLTDLVIPRLPINLNRSNSMLQRMETMGLYPTIQEALLQFRQGVGRLMRREGVTDRRLWVMDGRVFAPWPGMEELRGGILRFLRNYEAEKRLARFRLEDAPHHKE